MEILLLLLSAHFIADFYLKAGNSCDPRYSKDNTAKKIWQHFLIRTLLFSFALSLTKLSLFSVMIALTIISLSHLLSVYCRSFRTDKLRYFLLDQSIQLLIIIIVWGYISNITLAQMLVFIGQFLSAKNMIIAMSYLLVCKPASVIISLALKKHTDNLAKVPADTQNHANENIDNNVGLLSAGAWIGYIERCLAISFIFMGQFAGIGFLVATKTIFRFGDLTKNKDMKLTEYMMLGTLLSYAIALFIGWNAMQLYRVM